MVRDSVGYHPPDAVRLTYQLRLGWSAWPTAHALPTEPEEAFWVPLHHEWEEGHYVGTFGEYDMGPVRRPPPDSRSHREEPVGGEGERV